MEDNYDVPADTALDRATPGNILKPVDEMDNSEWILSVSLEFPQANLPKFT